MSNIEKLILGTVQMGLDYGVNNTGGKVSLDNSLAILGHAYESGMLFLDTAEAYGNAHEVIRIFHQNNPDSKFNIITKVPRVIDKNTINKVYDYLNVLQVEILDTLMFHAFSTFKSNPDSLESMIQLKEKGLVKKIGISIYTNEEFKEVLDNKYFDIIQIPFNLFDNWTIRGALIKEAKSKGKIIHTRSVFLQGLFFKTPQDKNNIVQALQNELILINNIANNAKKTIGSIALNYCLQNQLIDNVLIGVDTIAQLKDNLSIASEKIDNATIENINNIKIQDLKLLNPSLWN